MKSFFRWMTSSHRQREHADAMWQMCRTEYKNDAQWVYHNIMKNGSSYEDIRRMTNGR
jgi:hypothetical protein